MAARRYHSSSSSVTAAFVSKLWRLINGGRGGGIYLLPVLRLCLSLKRRSMVRAVCLFREERD